MKSVKGSAEAEIRVEEDGSAILSAFLLRPLHASPGSKVLVRVTPVSFGKDLLTRGVTEDEIERIASLQAEQRASVVSFLLSEGALSADKSFRRRMKRRGR
jgi:hypothetical protein